MPFRKKNYTHFSLIRGLCALSLVTTGTWTIAVACITVVGSVVAKILVKDSSETRVVVDN